jgi:hypothetical protein
MTKNFKELIEKLKKYREEFLSPTPGDVHVNQPMGKKKRQHADQETYTIDAMPVFKLGVWKGEDFSLADLDEIVKNTNILIKANLIEPPIKLGHDDNQVLLQNDGYPAGGYIRNVYRMGDQIFADVTNVPEKLYKLIEKKAYKNVSAEIYQDYEHPVTKEKMGKVLRAVAVLGADLPEVKGLADILNQYTTKELAYVSFSEKEFKEAYEMKTEFTLKEIEGLYPCCSDKCKKYMEENKLTKLDGEKLAEIVTEVTMHRYDDTTPPPAEKKCPPGHKWDETIGKCVTTNADDKDKPEEQKICPEGHVWNDEQNKCVEVPATTNAAGAAAGAGASGEPIKKNPKDMLAEIMAACGFKKDDKKDILEQFPNPNEFLSNIADIYMKAKGEKITPEEKKFIEAVVKLFADGIPEAGGLDNEPEAWTDEEKETAKGKHAKDPNPNKDTELEGYPDDKRPPKGWFDKCIAAVSGKTDTPEKLCGHIYAHQLSPAAKGKAEATRQAPASATTAQSEKVKELTEKIRKMTVDKYKEKVLEIRNKNKGIFIPALDGYIDSLVSVFTEVEDRVVKFGEGEARADMRASELFMKFMQEIAKQKKVIFGEIAKITKHEEALVEETATEEETDKITKKYTENSKGKTLKGVDEAASALKLSKAKGISLRDALLAVSKKSKKEGEE